MSRISTLSENLAIGQRLAAIRAATGLNQNEFAESLGLSPRAYANYERGEREMPVVLFRALLDVHRIDPVWLLTGPEPEPVRVLERRLDLPVLEALIKMVEENLRRAGKSLKPEKKARFIRLAYERCILAGKMDNTHIRELLSLAA